MAELTDEVQAYYTTIYGGPDTSPMEADDFAPPRGDFVVLEAGGAAVAMGGWRRGGPEAGDAEIKRMYVREGHRGRGHARSVLAWIERSAREAGVTRLVLETGEAQPEAIALYLSSGYSRIPAFGYYGHEGRSAHLAKPLT